MFSQWRQAVENLAQHSPKSSQDLSSDEHQARSSLDLGLRASLSSSQLAESALTSLKKTLVAQRSGSPGPSRMSPSISDGNTKQPSHRSTLEDRLRAKLAAGDVSNSASPSSSTRVSPSPQMVLDHPLSPTSTPLPESPLSHTAAVKDPLDILSPSPSLMRSAPLAFMTSPETTVSASPEEIHTSPQYAAHDPLSPTSIPLPDSPVLSPQPDPGVFLASGSLIPSLLDKGDPTPPHDPQNAEQTVGGGAGMLGVESDATTPNPKSSIQLDTTTLTENQDTSQQVDTAESVSSSNVDQSTEPLAHSSEMPESERVDPAKFSPAGEESSDELTSNAPQSASLSSEDGNREDVVEVLDNGPPSAVVESQSDATTGSGPSRPRDNEPDVEELQKRLKLVEQRFSDVSTSFKRLQAEKLAVDKVLRELTPLESMQETDALRDYLQTLNFKTEMAQDEIKRLTGKLTRQEERIEELRDIHRLESKSQSDQIEKLKGQVDEAEALLQATQSSTAQLQEETAKREAELKRMQEEVERANGVAKEEEEKRVKAIALLKTVRQKLVKAEKERDDVLKEIQAAKEKEKEEREKEKAEKLELRREIDRVNAERETTVNGLKTHFDKEVAGLKERYEKELLALKGQFELEAITAKNSYTRELENKTSRISELQGLVRSLEGEKDEFFDQLQLRQAELESSRSRLESLESQTTEFQYQLREANDRIALLSEELADARRSQEIKPQAAGPSAEEVTRLLSAAEVKYESRISDLRQQLIAVEREREEGEAEWSRKLSDKVRELESLRGILNSSARNQVQGEESAKELRQEIELLKDEIQTYQSQISDLRTQVEKVAEVENTATSEIAEVNARLVALQEVLEESKTREAQLRSHNKTLREELRKVQSSAALLERQRNPGVGYWASRQEGMSDTRSPRSSVSDLAMRESTSRPGSPTTIKSDEEINVEYLRNVILQFLEHKEMRPHLVRILSTILRFTPQETRRLISKV